MRKEGQCQLFFLASKAARLSIRNRTYKEKVEEYAKKRVNASFSSWLVKQQDFQSGTGLTRRKLRSMWKEGQSQLFFLASKAARLSIRNRTYKEKLRSMRKEGQCQLFFLASKAARLSIRNRTYKEKVEEYAKRGSMKAIAYQLQRAADDGKLESKHVLCSLLESISRNLNVEKHGKRYTAPMQSFFEVILLWGGPWLANFVSLHIFGPEIHTLFRWRKN